MYFLKSGAMPKLKKSKEWRPLNTKMTSLCLWSVRTRVNTHHNPPTACSIKELEVIFPLYTVSKESFVTMVLYQVIHGFS